MPQQPSRGGAGEVERLFEEWLARQPAPRSAGGALSPPEAGSRASTPVADTFDAFCAKHSEHAGALRKLHADWQHIVSLIERSGLTVSVVPTRPAPAGEPTAPSPSLTERIRERYGPGVDPGITLEAEGAETPVSDFSSEILKRLSSRPDASGRYRIHGKVGHGGQGVVFRVWDEDLHRHLAMKLSLGKVTSSPAPAKGEAATPAKGAAAAPANEAAAPAKEETSTPEASTPPLDARTVGRFLEEAQVTGQLDHPGIVPVHELGLDAKGRVFFTMKLVKGEDLKAVFARVHSEEEGWTVTRVLSLRLKMCEAMSYAHAKRVIHRDLKPANIMVGRYGEVFVMDWGMARVLGREDHKDIRVRPPEPPVTSELRSERHEQAESDSDSPLVTMDGDVVGTPAYMPPEQASGKLDRMGPTSDVYALGAMLYHLLSGQMPYVPPDARLSARTILGLVVQGPPRPLHELRADVPPELDAICEKAMARESGDRYADMSALADDLRAYLEGRVVRAYEVGALAELKKWVSRNKALAAAGTIVVALLSCMPFAWSEYSRVRLERERAEEAAVLSNLGFTDARATETECEVMARLCRRVLAGESSEQDRVLLASRGFRASITASPIQSGEQLKAYLNLKTTSQDLLPGLGLIVSPCWYLDSIPIDPQLSDSTLLSDAESEVLLSGGGRGVSDKVTTKPSTLGRHEFSGGWRAQFVQLPGSLDAVAMTSSERRRDYDRTIGSELFLEVPASSFVYLEDVPGEFPIVVRQGPIVEDFVRSVRIEAKLQHLSSNDDPVLAVVIEFPRPHLTFPLEISISQAASPAVLKGWVYASSGNWLENETARGELHFSSNETPDDLRVLVVVDPESVRQGWSESGVGWTIGYPDDEPRTVSIVFIMTLPPALPGTNDAGDLLDSLSVSFEGNKDALKLNPDSGEYLLVYADASWTVPLNVKR